LEDLHPAFAKSIALLFETLMLVTAWSAWVQIVTEVAGTTVEGAVLASDPLVGKGPASHGGGEHDR
jgi:hypothetical protein